MRPFLSYLRHLFSASVLDRKMLRSLIVLPLGFQFFLPSSVATSVAHPSSVVDPRLIVNRLSDEPTLPVADIYLEQDGDDVGTVVFLPQYHRYPGSDVEDKRNDAGFATQQELYAILQQVISEMSVDTVFVEGEFQGPVSEDERKRLAARIQTLEDFERQLLQVKTVLGSYLTPQELEAVLKEAEASAAHARRGIVLEGAPEQLWAEGGDIVLYGTENPVTREMSAELVRDYVYLRDQMKRVGGVSVVPDPGSSLFELNDELRVLLYQRLMERYGAHANGSSSLQHWLELYLTQKASSAPRMTAFQVLDALKEQLPEESADALLFVDSFKGSWEALLREPLADSTPSHAPSRSENPYREIYDRTQLEQLVEENEQQIETVVVERRNQETAEVVSRVMHEQGEEIVVLQFGAGHEDGLVEALRAQNLSVITVIPNAVAQGRLAND